MDLLLNVHAGSLLQPKIIIAPLNVDNKLFFNKIRDCLLNFSNLIRARVNPDDLLFGRTEPLELLQNIN